MRALKYIRQTAIISSYGVNRLFFVIKTEFLYCPVRTDSFGTNQVKFCVHIFNICCVERWLCAGIQLLNPKRGSRLTSLLQSYLDIHKTIKLMGNCTEHKVCNLILSANYTRKYFYCDKYLVSFTRRTFRNVRPSVV